MKKTISIISLVSILIFAGFGCKPKVIKYDTSLDIWGVFDNTSAYSEIFEEYQKANPNINKVTYHKHTIDSYKKDLIDAMAAGNGPDIFLIHNSWLPDFQDKIAPIPANLMTEQAYRNNFVDVVADDFIQNGQMYSMPMSVDSLALYYNKDIFNAAGITHPPKTWNEFNAVVKKLVKVDEFGNFNQIATSLGTAFNVNRSVDLLTMFMLQNGTEMSDAEGNIAFAEPINKNGTTVLPGDQALRYYTDFANATSSVYTWNKQQNYSIDDFYEGQSAMMINYSWHYDTIKAKNAKLNFAVADLPQISLDTVGDQANFANYWSFVVAKNKIPVQSRAEGATQITNEIRIFEAWQALIALTFPTEKGIYITNAVTGEQAGVKPAFDLTEKYLEKTRKPAARRDIVSKQQSDVRLGSFAKGNLIARTWLRNEAEAVEVIFADMIDSVNTGKSSVYDAVKLGSTRVQQLQK